MPKISALPPMTTADAADEAPIVDTSASATKKWTLTLLKTYLQSLVGWVSTAMLANNAVTAAKVETQQAWIAPTLLNSWVNYGGTASTAGYMKDSMGFVHLKGLIKTGTPGTVEFNLPVGYRPEQYLRIPTVASGVYGSLDINTTGDVLHATGSSTFSSLDGVVFKAA